MLSACRCTFKRDEREKWESGVAVTTEHGLSDVVVIVPDDATTPADVLREIYDYRLDWTHSIDGGALRAQNEYFSGRPV